MPWALALLVPSTSLAVASVSVWLVPPYLGLMALILFVPGGRAGRSGLAGAVGGLEPSGPKQVPAEEASRTAETPGFGRADGPSEAPPGQVQAATETSTMTATAAPPKSRRGGSDGGNGANPGQGRGRGRNKSKTKATPTAEPTWIQVAPGKFVRAEAGGPIPPPILPTTDPEGAGTADSEGEGPSWGLELDEYADADADVADGLLFPCEGEPELADPEGLVLEGDARPEDARELPTGRAAEAPGWDVEDESSEGLAGMPEGPEGEEFVSTHDEPEDAAVSPEIGSVFDGPHSTPRDADAMETEIDGGVEAGAFTSLADTDDDAIPLFADATPAVALGLAAGLDDGAMPAAWHADHVGDAMQGPDDDRASVDEPVDAGAPTADCGLSAQAVSDGPECDLALPEDLCAWDAHDAASATTEDGVESDLGCGDAAQDDGQSPDARAWGDRDFVADSTEVQDNGNAPDAWAEEEDDHEPDFLATDDVDGPGVRAEGDNGNAPDAPGTALLAEERFDDVDPYAAEVAPSWPSRTPAVRRALSPTGRVPSWHDRPNFAPDARPRREFAGRSGAARAMCPPGRHVPPRPPQHPAASRGKVRRLGRPRRNCPTRAPPVGARAPPGVRATSPAAGFGEKFHLSYDLDVRASVDIIIRSIC
ncbi:hypothetical protein EP7_002487 [Isosphaeraceae bacterium EP7]